MIKLLIATGSFGGPATYSKLLSAKLPSYGYKIKVVNFGDVLKYPKILRHLAYFLKVLFGSFGADIIYAQDPVSVGLPAVIAAKILRQRFFLKIVGDYAWEQGQQRYSVNDLLDDFVKKNNYPFPVRFFKWLQTYVAKRAEKIIVPSQYLKKTVGEWGIDKNKITVVYNAFVNPDTKEEKNNLRKKLNFTYPTIVSVGRLVPWKGFLTLIEAFAKIKNNHKDATLIIIDDGPDKKNLEQKVARLELSGTVRFLGKIDHQEVYEYIKAGDIFALLSSYEGFSHLLLEALALGTPIVTTPVGGNVEVIKDGENGFFVPFGDVDKTTETINKILSDQSLAEKLSSKGREMVSRFSEEDMLKNLAAILR